MPHPACHLPVFLSALLPLAILAQEPLPNSAPPKPVLPVFTSAREAVPTVTERGAHHRVEQWVERILGEDGTTNDITHSYTVLANGMHYLNGGEWRETVPEFVPVNGGWLAARGPHQVLVSEELFVTGAVTVVSPEGQTWRSTPMTLALRDRAGGQVWVLGESRATRGELAAANTVLFRDAFAGDAGLRADVRVVTSAGGVECDVIVRSGVPTREALGEAGEHAELVVLTEIFEPGGASATPVDRGGRSDDVVRLGALTMDQGQAFGTDLPGEPTRSVPVFKRVYQDAPSGRVFLEEATPLDSLTSLLEALPGAKVPGQTEARWRNTAGWKTRPPGSAPGSADFPVRRVGMSPAPSLPRRADGRFEVAGAGSERRTFAGVAPTPGVVLDWSYLNSATNFTFRGDTTYYATNQVQFSGTNVTFEAGTVIKFSGDSSAGLQVNSGTAVQWLGEPYAPITLTAKDDDAIGEKITGSTGQPGGSRYGGTYLFVNSPAVPVLVQHARFRFARTAFGAGSAFGTNIVTLRHAQVTDSENAFRFQYGGTASATYGLQNLLLARAGTVFKDFYQARADAAFATLDMVTNWFSSVYSPHASTVAVNDSILSAVGSVNVGTTNNCWVASSGSGLFEAAGAGAYYLPRASAVRTIMPAEEVNPVPEVLLAGMSSRPPHLLSSPISGTTNLDSAVHNWVGTAPEEETIGYHYPQLHFVVTNVVVTNAVVTLTNGVSVAFAGPAGFALKSGAQIRSTGTPLSPNRLVWAGLVQESATYPALTNSAAACFSAATGTTRPEIAGRFTEIFFGPGTTARRTVMNDTTLALASFSLRDCRVFNGYLYFFPPNANASQVVGLTNSLFENTSVTFYRDYAANDLQATVRNNLFRRGQLYCGYFWAGGGYPPYPTWTVKDNLFDGATATSSGSGYVAASHNGYTAATATLGGSGNKTSLVPDYVTGPLGRFYYPASGGGSSLATLINAGSLTNAGLVGLFHYTTTTNLVLVETNTVGALKLHAYSSREGSSPVDIGFHCVAGGESWDTNGSVIFSQVIRDADIDLLPDYREDLNGDGIFESPESHWLFADSDFDFLDDRQEAICGTNPASPDSDGDGFKDGPEYLNGMNPLDAYSRSQQRTGHWGFDGGSFVSDEGITPITATAALVDSYNGTAAAFATTNHQLRLPWTRTVGASTVTNFHFWNGGVRFTYVPSWYAGGVNDKPTNWVRLLECGDWKLSIEPEGKFLVFQTPATYPPIRTNLVVELPRPAGPAGRIGWEITLDYRPWSSRVTINDTGSNGLGVEADLPAAVKNGGLWVGSGAHGSSPALGFLDELEWFNSAVVFGENPFSVLWSPVARRAQVLSATGMTNGLKLSWVRGWEGDWLTNSSLYSISRRPAGSLGAWTMLASGLRTNSWVDTTATNGGYYEYRTDRHASVLPVSHPSLVAARNGSPVDDRGRAILLVDQTLTNALWAELESFKRLLAADGWTVTNYFVPRHVDQGSSDHSCTTYNASARPTNTANQAVIRSNLWHEYTNNPGASNVVIIVGHVTIPYSGLSGREDGHSDHDGGWVTDAWYGDLTGTWTDTGVMNNPQFCINSNGTNDGRWDQHFLPLESDGSPGRLELPLGRIDFARLPVFVNTNVFPGVSNVSHAEVLLHKRYFDKVQRFRRSEIGHLDDTRIWAPQPGFFGMIEANRRLHSRLWGGENPDHTRLTNDVFLAATNYLWGFHGDFGHFKAVGKDQGEPREHTHTQIAVEGEIPRGMFMLTFGSYFADWFHENDDVLRVCLGMSDTALTVSWQGGLNNSEIVWRTDAMQAGGPVGWTLRDTFAAQTKASCRATFLLGDPTLREHYLTPVSGFSASKSGGNVNLVWTHQAAATAGYRLYWANSTNTAQWNLLTNLAAGATSWTHTPGNPSNNAYLLKAAALKITGSGSYINLSLGVAAPSEITIP